jgi:hypothetical protein
MARSQNPLGLDRLVRINGEPPCLRTEVDPRFLDTTIVGMPFLLLLCANNIQLACKAPRLQRYHRSLSLVTRMYVRVTTAARDTGH